MKEKTPTRELLRCTVQYYSPQHAQIGQFSTIVSMRGRFLFQRSAVPRTRAPSWGDISFTRTRLSTHRQRRGPGTPEPHTPPVWRAPEGPEGTGGLRGGAGLRRPWAAAGPGRASRRRAERSSRRGRLAGGPPPTGAPSSPAPQQDQTAPGTPAEPQTQTQTRQSGPEPLGSGPPSMLSGDQQRATRVSSARPPCRPCRSSRR